MSLEDLNNALKANYASAGAAVKTDIDTLTAMDARLTTAEADIVTAEADIDALEAGGALGLDDTLPTGVTSADLEARYKFDGSASSLLDRTANGHDLSLATGTERYACVDGSPGALFDASTYYQTATSRTGLHITGALTIEMLLTPSVADGGTTKSIIAQGGQDGGDPETNNFLWLIDQQNYVNDFAGLTWFQENGAGNNNMVTFTKAHMTQGAKQLVQFTRAADGVTCKVALGGYIIETQTQSNAPTGGGTDTRLCIGSDLSLQHWAGVIHEVRIFTVAFSAAQLLESAQSAFYLA